MLAVWQEIIPFIDEHWEQLTVAPRRVKHTWHSSIAKTMVSLLCAETFMLLLLTYWCCQNVISVMALFISCKISFHRIRLSLALAHVSQQKVGTWNTKLASILDRCLHTTAVWLNE